MIPVTGRGVCDVKVAWNERKEMCLSRQGVVDETCCEWMPSTVRKDATHLDLSQREVREMICDQMQNTEKNVRATRCSVFTLRRVHDTR